MGDVNAILNGEIFILRGKMNSIERVERDAKCKSGLRETICMSSSSIIAVQLQLAILCMRFPVFPMQKDFNFFSSLTEFADFQDFKRLKRRRTKTRRFPDGDPFVRVLSFIVVPFTRRNFLFAVYIHGERQNLTKAKKREKEPADTIKK